MASTATRAGLSAGGRAGTPRNLVGVGAQRPDGDAVAEPLAGQAARGELAVADGHGQVDGERRPLGAEMVTSSPEPSPLTRTCTGASARATGLSTSMVALLRRGEQAAIPTRDRATTMTSQARARILPPSRSYATRGVRASPSIAALFRPC